MKLKTGDRVTVWVGEQTAFGQLVRGTIYDADEMERNPSFRRHQDDRVKNGMSRLHEWRTASGGVRLIDEKDEGIKWLPGWSNEIDAALRAARALL